MAELRERDRQAPRPERDAQLAIERERLDATRRRLTAIDERLTGAIGMVPTIIVPQAPRESVRAKPEPPSKRKPAAGNGRPRRPGEVPPAPNSRD